MKLRDPGSGKQGKTGERRRIGNTYRHYWGSAVEIISEASRRLPDDLKVRHPSIAWPDIAGAGNIYRHDYKDLAAQHLWDTVQIDLPPLRGVITQELAALDSPPTGYRPQTTRKT